MILGYGGKEEKQGKARIRNAADDVSVSREGQAIIKIYR